MKKVISFLLMLAIIASLCIFSSGCLDNKTALTVSNNGEEIKYTIDDFLEIGTEKVSISWLDSKGNTGKDVFEGIYFSKLIDYADDIGLNRVEFSVINNDRKKYINEKLIKNTGVDTSSPFIAINNNNTLSIIYPQLTIDMVNKDLWVNDIKKIERISEQIIFTISVDSYEKQFTEKDISKLKTIKQNYSWTDAASNSGNTELDGITIDELGINMPHDDFMMVVEDINGIEYNFDIDMDFQLNRLSNYLSVDLNKNMSYKEFVKAIKSSKTDFPLPMIAVMKNNSVMLPFPQISGDNNKEDWIYDVISISIESN